jgi:hypothetical protein
VVALAVVIPVAMVVLAVAMVLVTQALLVSQRRDKVLQVVQE